MLIIISKLFLSSVSLYRNIHHTHYIRKSVRITDSTGNECMFTLLDIALTYNYSVLYLIIFKVVRKLT